jgi:hypothetical protein
LPYDDERLVGGLGQLVRPWILMRVERSLGLGDELVRARSVRARAGEEVHFPPGHGETVERSVLDQLGLAGKFREDLVSSPLQASRQVDEDPDHHHHEHGGDDEEDERRALDGHAPFPPPVQGRYRV